MLLSAFMLILSHSTKPALCPICCMLMNYRPFLQFPKPIVWKPLTSFSHSKQCILFILLFAYLSSLMGPPVYLSRSINSLNHCNTTLDICSVSRNSHFQSPFCSSPRVQIQKFDYVTPLLTIDHRPLMTHNIRFKIICLPGKYLFMFLLPLGGFPGQI